MRLPTKPIKNTTISQILRKYRLLAGGKLQNFCGDDATMPIPTSLMNRIPIIIHSSYKTFCLVNQINKVISVDTIKVADTYALL